MKHTSLKQLYTEKSIPALEESFGYANALAVPRILKVTVNAGIGRFLKESQRVDEIVQSLQAITGQKVVMTKARKAIAGFKTREGLDVGVRVTLRGDRMWQFLDRLVKASLPRIRDFQGIDATSVDSYGNLNIGLRDHTMFPEIIPEKVVTVFGFQVTVTTTAKTKEEGVELFRTLGFPLRKKEDKEK
ncbi:MAG: 50S ribosomal protein L5 [Candidatus Moraniibacteriota bacterium]